MNLDKEIEKAIKLLLAKVSATSSMDGDLKTTQAALNLAHVSQTLAATEWQVKQTSKI